MDKPIMNNKGDVFYENGTWNFIAKTINRGTFTIEYEIKTGFYSIQ